MHDETDPKLLEMIMNFENELSEIMLTKALSKEMTGAAVVTAALHAVALAAVGMDIDEDSLVRVVRKAYASILNRVGYSLVPSKSDGQVN